jgi:hypothetical protein
MIGYYHQIHMIRSVTILLATIALAGAAFAARGTLLVIEEETTIHSIPAANAAILKKASSASAEQPQLDRLIQQIDRPGR